MEADPSHTMNNFTAECAKKEPFEHSRETLCEWSKASTQATQLDTSNVHGLQCSSKPPNKLPSEVVFKPREPHLVSVTPGGGVQVWIPVNAQLHSRSCSQIAETTNPAPVPSIVNAVNVNHLQAPLFILGDAQLYHNKDSADTLNERDVMDNPDGRSREVVSEEQRKQVKRQQGTYKNYTLEEKKEALRLAAEHSFGYVAEHLQIPKSTILQWSSRFKSGLLDAKVIKKGRPLKYSSGKDVEIRDWVLKQIDENKTITRDALCEHAQKVTSNPNFKASYPWLKCFLKRHNLKNICIQKPNHRGTYKNYTLEEKKEALRLAAKHSFGYVAEHLQIPKSTILQWSSKFKSGLLDDKAKKGRPLKYNNGKDLEIRDWVLKQIDENKAITRDALCEHARKVVNQPDFKASACWLKTFLNRHGFVKFVTCNSKKCIKLCNLGSHCSSMMASNKPYACKICAKSFAHPSRLKRHFTIQSD